MFRNYTPSRNLWILAIMACVRLSAPSQLSRGSDIQVHLALQAAGGGTHFGKKHMPPAVIWLKPLDKQELSFPPHGRFTLVQKNRMFSPHLLIVPVGSVVLFPNADPFFHDVFSLFDGKRFDLGLYEAGSTKEVTFSREGLSYIFCNIHPEMSAVVIALATPLYAVDDADGNFQIHDAPPGEYEMNVWVEGEAQPALNRLARQVHIAAGTNHLADIVTSAPARFSPHDNKFGQPYTTDPKTSY